MNPRLIDIGPPGGHRIHQAALNLNCVCQTCTREATLKTVWGVHPATASGSDSDLSLIPCLILFRTRKHTKGGTAFQRC